MPPENGEKKDPRLIRWIRIENLLSFGEMKEPFELLPLNVFIGANGSGKSNFVEVLGLLQAMPKDLVAPIRSSGGMRQWFHSGTDFLDERGIEVSLNPEGVRFFTRTFDEFRHEIRLDHDISDSPLVGSETIAVKLRKQRTDGSDTVPLLSHEKKSVRLQSVLREDLPEDLSSIPSEDLQPNQSGLRLARNARHLPELSALGDAYEAIEIHREWSVGRGNKMRSPQRMDVPAIPVHKDGTNLAIALNSATDTSALHKKFEEYLSRACRRYAGFHVDLSSGSPRLFLRESIAGEEEKFSVERISDGTLRILQLMAILLHPKPAPLIVIEEPEIGLHPDAMLVVRDMLLEASQHTQVVVTTHSDALISALSDTPECVVVVDHDGESTQLTRLSGETLRGALKDYSLSELWAMGQIGENP